MTRTLFSSAGAAIFGAGLVFLLPSVASANAPTSEPDSEMDPRIFGGMEVETCAWPTTVAVQSGGGLCSGTLVAPNLVTYAAHCGGGAKTIRFSEDTLAGQKYMSSNCVTNPNWNNNPGQDWAYCVLPEPVDLPVTPVVYGCETSILQPGAEIAIVGFGNNVDGAGAGTKRWKFSNIGAINWNANTIQMQGYCQGDSGGPSFVKYPSGSWHAISIVSVGVCGGSGTHALLPGALPWIEEDSGVDITPCFDDEGDWAPTPLCAGFYTGGSSGTGTWTDWCEGTPAGGSHDTCGDPYDAVPDDAAPSVTITAPESGGTYDMDPSPVDISVAADDAGGWGVKNVWLQINGADQPPLTNDPYEWSQVPFPKGGYTVYAFAEDWAGNVGKSDPITFGVQQDAPDPPPPEDDETGGTDGSGTGTGPGLDDGGEGGGDPGGCGCSSTPARGSGAAALLLLGLVSLRRRRHPVL
jgi:MYXO-CTERM domain-containing protein